MNRRQYGFTLMELMVVVLVIGIIVAIGVPVYMAARGTAEKNTCQSFQRTWAGVVQQVKASDQEPTGSDQAKTLVENGSVWYDAARPFLKSIPVCPTSKNPYWVYEAAIGVPENGDLVGCAGTSWAKWAQGHTPLLPVSASLADREGIVRPSTLTVEYLVVAGGGGAGYRGGGGAGGFQTASLTASVGTAYSVVVGVGGAGDSTNRGYNGGNSTFATVTSIGGGGGAGMSMVNNYWNGLPGGSGGGSMLHTPGAGTPGQGNAGSDYGAGGGAGAPGSGYNGGAGRSSDITGAVVWYAGGGASNFGTGGTGGGGSGPLGPLGGGKTAGTPQTGGGGAASGGSGGSGIVVLKIDDAYTATFSAGVTYTRITSVPGYNIYKITAAGAGQTVTIQ